jgi:multiple sugar transport system ATP-binding protein
VARVSTGVIADALAEIRLDGVSKRFGSDRWREGPAGKGRGDGARGHEGPVGKGRQDSALAEVTLSVERGEVVVVVGPSGCGKSTLLRIVAGLEEPDSGAVTLGGRSMSGVPPQDRDVAMVFQGYALYPHMTARQIMEFPLKMRRVPAARRADSVAEAAGLLRIEHLLERRPDEMSGGERQRVAMGRAIVRKPRAFLFDEPLSNLDASLRSDLRGEIAQLVRRLGATALYVTHDHVEAMTLADRIAVMRAGRVLQVGTPQEVYERPASAFVGSFLGSPRMNLVEARVEGHAIVAGPFRWSWPTPGLPARIEVGIRPEHVLLGDADRGATGVGPEVGEIVSVEPLGAESHLIVRVGPLELRAQSPGFEARRRGDSVGVWVDAARIHLFDAAADDRPRLGGGP